jgi:enamine deaminase RidA (YjgF/YER057c/UK114 family)
MTIAPIVPPDMTVMGQFTPAFRLSGGDLIVCSGIVPVNDAGETVGVADAYTQTKQVLENLRKVLRHADAGLADVVSLRVFSTDMANRQRINQARAEYFTGTPPASTHIQIVRLVDPEWLVEIEATAFIKTA